MTYLLDTCILSKLRKISKKQDPSLETWVTKHDESLFFISALTIGEIQQGISRLKDKKQKRIFEAWLLGEVVPRFEGKIISIDQKVASKWGELIGIHQKKGISIPVVDGLIASCAIVHDLILVTENIKDFERITNLKHFSPWEK